MKAGIRMGKDKMAEQWWVYVFFKIIIIKY